MVVGRHWGGGGVLLYVVGTLLLVGGGVPQEQAEENTGMTTFALSSEGLLPSSRVLTVGNVVEVIPTEWSGDGLKGVEDEGATRETTARAEAVPAPVRPQKPTDIRLSPLAVTFPCPSGSCAKGSAACGWVLSQYLGGESGTSTTQSNHPYTSVAQSPLQGFGIDCPGSFDAHALHFHDIKDDLAVGIGAVPPSALEFHLESFRTTGTVEQFQVRLGVAVSGVAAPIKGEDGAVFRVLLDGREVVNERLASRESSSVPTTVKIPDTAKTLTLITETDGTHPSLAAWGNATLVGRATDTSGEEDTTPPAPPCLHDGVRDGRGLCKCVNQWSGKYCQECSLNCGVHGVPDYHSCRCHCDGHWLGKDCGSCNLQCQRGGTLDTTACRCTCPTQWAGDDCSVCVNECQHGGVLDLSTCTCTCLSPWEGLSCEVCPLQCLNGGKVDEERCRCECPPTYGGARCDRPNLVSLELFDLPHFFVFYNGTVGVGKISPLSSLATRENATFLIVPGLADETLISFKCIATPNVYLVQEPKNTRILASVYGGTSATFGEDATFKITKGLADARLVSFESFRNPGYFLRHNKNRQLVIARRMSQQFKEEATFRLQTALCHECDEHFYDYVMRH